MISTDQSTSGPADIEVAVAISYVEDPYLAPIIATLLGTRTRYLRERLQLPGKPSLIAAQSVNTAARIAIVINSVTTNLVTTSKTEKVRETVNKIERGKS